MYGPTAGPWLRTFSTPSTPDWKQYAIEVVGQAKDGNDLVTIKSITNGALCEAYLTPEKADRCKDDFWAPIAHIGHRKPYTWRLVPVAGDDSYQIIAESRAAGCLKYLGASQSCSVGNVTLFAKDDGSRRQRWVLREVKGSTPKPSPPTKPNKLAAPLIQIAYPTGSTTGTASIVAPAGATKCVLASGGGEITFTPKFPTTTVKISNLEPGLVDILTCACTNSAGSSSPVSNEAPITLPTPANLVNSPTISKIEIVTVDTYNITYLPPSGDDCTPTSYNVTYNDNSGEKVTTAVPAAQPYGTAPTEIQVTNLPLSSSYDIVCVGIGSSSDPLPTSKPISASISKTLIFIPAHSCYKSH